MAKLNIPSKLVVLMNGRVIGEVSRNRSQLTFKYDYSWIGSDHSFPISMSMPISKVTHEHEKIYNFMWGLLPDNVSILQGIGRQHNIPTSNPFTLLWKIGEDCPGALQFVEADRVADAVNHGSIAPIDDLEIARRLKSLRSNSSIGRLSTSEGQFSLSGAQPKTALSFINGQWGIPSGRMPTTHILKPPISEYDGQVENEHFCLTLARKVGLPSAESAVMHFSDEIAIVVKRFDRHIIGDRVIRIHQEDMCQVLGVHPEFKYESNGGPGIIPIMDKLLSVSSPSDDRSRFMSAVIFNFLICGTDAHAKNYSVLHAPKAAKLAPLYDLISFLPYVEHMPSLKMPMKIDKYYEYESIQKRHWQRLAAATRYPIDDLFSSLDAASYDIPQAAIATADELRASGITHNVVNQLVHGIAKRCRNIRETLGFATTVKPKL